MKKGKYALRPWELALLMALGITLAVGLWAGRTQEHLADGLIRLHVVARSDSPDDQAEKLQTRDRALTLLAPLLAECESREEAAAVIEAQRPALEALGDVTVSLGTEYFPTRQYNTFALPAGEYLSLRLTLGEGGGKNWWCVVFPPLCTEALAEGAEDAFLSLDEAEAALITRESTAYELRFRVVDWWEKLTHAASRDNPAAEARPSQAPPGLNIQ